MNSSAESSDGASARFGMVPAQYHAVTAWAELSKRFQWVEVTATAVDSKDRVFVFNRGEDPVMIFEPDGTFVKSWGRNMFVRPHGITIGPDDCVFCTDDLDHTVHKFTPDGELMMTLGTSGKPSDTGATSIDYRTIRHSGPPFYFPTNVAIAADGDLFISDGYGNARVHRFSSDGKLKNSWGTPGAGPGQFHIPHGIAIDQEGLVWVADRENSRLQIFSPTGEFLREWTEIARPCQVCFDSSGRVYVAELGYRAGMWPGTQAPSADATGGRVSIFDRSGQLISRWGGGVNPVAPGDFFAPHDIRVDSKGAVYLSEVVISAGGNRGLVAPDCHTLQKFQPVLPVT